MKTFLWLRSWNDFQTILEEIVVNWRINFVFGFKANKICRVEEMIGFKSFIDINIVPINLKTTAFNEWDNELSRIDLV